MTTSTDPVFPNRAARRAAGHKGSKGRKLAALGSGAVLVSGAAGLAVSLSAAPAVAATTFTVDDSSDTGPTAADCAGAPDGGCSLRDAIAAANADAVEDLIVFDASVSGTITLGSDLEEITEAVDIQGPGASVLTVDGDDDNQIFFFNDIDSGTPSISGLTVTNGASNGRNSEDSGGAIALYYSDASFTFANLVVSSSYAYNDGGGLHCLSGVADVAVTDSEFVDNSAYGGGAGMYFHCNDLTVTGSTFTNNDADGGGGALYFSGANLVVSGSTFTESDADGGGAMFLDGDSHTITNTTISNNHAPESGGGIFLQAGTLHVSDSTIADNDAARAGGGLYLSGEEVLIERSTVSGNTADEDGGGVEIYDSGDVTILASAISGNTAGGNAGGLYLASSDTLLTIANSTIAGNTAGGNGGGIAFYGGELSLLQSTVSGNTATSGLGDGLYFQGADGPTALRAGAHADRAADKAAEHAAKVASGEAEPGDAPPEGSVSAAEAGAVTITGTIVSGNIGGEDLEAGGDNPVAVTANDSLLGGIGTSVIVSGARNLTGVNTPGLGALADNGGPTQTMALTATSPALDVGPATVPTFAGNGFDQRGTGFARVVNGRVDIGAFERELEGLFTG